MAHDSLHILLIEDEPTLAQITAFRLELLGYEVATVTSAEEAFAHLETNLPNVIILDLALCGNEGLELLNRLSNEPRTSQVPVLVFSTNAELEGVQRAYTAGANDYLVTPYDPANLESKIEHLTVAVET